MKITVYKGQYGFSTLAKNGEDKMYIQVQFKKGAEPISDSAKITITDGFFSCYKTKDEVLKPKLVVLDYLIDEGQDSYEDPFENVTPINGDMLPF